MYSAHVPASEDARRALGRTVAPTRHHLRRAAVGSAARSGLALVAVCASCQKRGRYHEVQYHRTVEYSTVLHTVH